MKKISTSTYFDFHGVASLIVEGKGALLDYLRYQYSDFIQINENKNADLYLKIIDRVIYGKRSNCYAEGKSIFRIDGEMFHWEIYGKSIFFKGDGSLASVSTIYCDAGFNRIQLNMIIELFLRIRFSAAGIALVHAACFSDEEGNAMLIPAAKSTGKTALCLNAIKSGFEFLSDDRVWLGKTGKVFAFPRYIVITKSNVKYFHALEGKRNKFRSIINKCILAITPGKRLNNMMKKILHRFFPFRAVYYKIQELYPSSKSRMQAKLSGTTFLVRDLNSHNIPRVIDPDTTEIFISQVANLEWNYSLLEAVSIHDILFISKPIWHEELQILIQDERDIINQALKGRHAYCLELNGDLAVTNWDDIVRIIQDCIFSKKS